MSSPLTVSSYAPQIMYSGLVQFNVENYNDRKNLGYATFIRSPTYTVGGHEWTLHYYPDGRSEETEGHVSVSLELMSADNACVILALTFANEVDRSAWAGWATVAFLNSDNQFLFRWPEVRSEVFEQMGLVRNDCLEIQCHICVLRQNQLVQAGLLPEVEVPASDMFRNIGKFMAEQVTPDVTFKVEQETFHGHRIMLAACSPVFDRQLNGQMRDEDLGNIVVHDMQPSVFRALLHFVYTDSLIQMNDIAVHDQIELIRHLLVAADRYCMDRLKNMCEDILCRCQDMESLITSVTFAEQYQCKKLLVACGEFLRYSMESDMVASQWYNLLKDNFPDAAAEVCQAANDARQQN